MKEVFSLPTDPCYIARPTLSRFWLSC